MSDRTEQIVQIMAESTSYFILPEYAREAIDALRDAGFTIAHQDDYEEAPPWHLNAFDDGYQAGWNNLRRHLFDQPTSQDRPPDHVASGPGGASPTADGCLAPRASTQARSGRAHGAEAGL